MVEEWREVSGHEGYEVSNLGRIRSYRNRQGHPAGEPRMMATQTVKGYSWIKLGRKFQSAVHRLVARAFLGPCPEAMECRHLDGNRANARLDNLAYGTKAENYNDRRSHGTNNDGERHGLAKLTDEQARQIRSLSHLTSDELVERFGVGRSTISRVRGHRSYRTA